VTLAPDIASIDSLLSEEERAIRDRVRAFAAGVVEPMTEHWERASFPYELLPGLGALGIAGGPLTGYGCAGWSNMAYGLALAELARASASLSTTVHVQSGLAMTAIWMHGSEEQKTRWLPPMSRMEAIGAFAATEPEAGSDLGSLRTTAGAVDGGYSLNGEKRWIGHGTVCNVACVFARGDDGRIGGYLVEKGTLGWTAELITGKGSQRAVWQAHITMRDCVVPAENRLPGVSGLGDVLRVLSHSRFGVAWDALGQAKACYDAALAHALERRQFGAPLASKQLVQQKLVVMASEIALADALTVHVSRLMDAGEASPALISMLKMNNATKARAIAAAARDLLGGDGILLERQVMTHMADIEGPYTYEGTNDTNMLIVGQAITGHRAF
jgi:glutaryl-CoA dehydrogenase